MVPAQTARELLPSAEYETENWATVKGPDGKQ